MSTGTFEAGQWGLILGGSSGFGLATAHKLARHGLNLCLVHRDRRGAMKRIEPEFEAMRERGIELVTYNTDALGADGRAEVLDGLADAIADGGGVRLLLHSIAFGNLKLVAPESPSGPREAGDAVPRLAAELGLDPERVAAAADRLFADGLDGLQGLSSPPEYAQDRLLEDEDVARTIYAMGTSLLTWTQELQRREMFASDARVLGLTSEGNEVAWKGYAAVSAAKTALEAISRSIAVEMAHFGIRSNIVQAGVTDTPALRAIPGSAHLVAQARVRNPFGRLTTPEDVADVVYLLALPESAWINGALVRVDGGERVSGTSR
jgi:NAD(P)-dependent dehydrogenase (short-subunit alcohol dehydrogenase family)